MKENLEDFIYSCAEFNSCIFCNKFGLTGACPLKNAYFDEHEPTQEEVVSNGVICKKYVISSLRKLLA